MKILDRMRGRWYTLLAMMTQLLNEAIARETARERLRVIRLWWAYYGQPWEDLPLCLVSHQQSMRLRFDRLQNRLSDIGDDDVMCGLDRTVQAMTGDEKVDRERVYDMLIEVDTT